MFHRSCEATDDSIMTIAIAKAVMESTHDNGCVGPETLEANATYFMQKIGRYYPYCGYGGRFSQWMFNDNPQSYGSYGNGAAMRVSPCGEIAGSLEEAVALSRAVTVVTHDHVEGLKGAEAVAVCIYLARTGLTKEQIKEYVCENYYNIDFTLDGIRDSYAFNETCQDTVPQALEAFFESENFEDAIRNAISIGGDSDTLAAITGSIAENYYGIPGWMVDKAMGRLNHHLREIVYDWYHNYK